MARKKSTPHLKANKDARLEVRISVADLALLKAAAERDSRSLSNWVTLILVRAAKEDAEK